MTEEPGPARADAQTVAQQRAEFRAFVREHHPDRGGDPEAFVAGLARFEATRSAATPVSERRYDAPIEVVVAHPLPLRVAIALIRTVRRHRSGRVR